MISEYISPTIPAFVERLKVAYSSHSHFSAEVKKTIMSGKKDRLTIRQKSYRLNRQKKKDNTFKYNNFYILSHILGPDRC